MVCLIPTITPRYSRGNGWHLFSLLLAQGRHRLHLSQRLLELIDQVIEHLDRRLNRLGEVISMPAFLSSSMG